jgi:erythronate-4-phosphate dehydrogenase
MPGSIGKPYGKSKELKVMKIVCSSTLAYPRDAFETLGEVLVLPDRSIGPEDVREAELLIVRSTTAINARLLENSRVRFVGTATIGTDHMDMGWMESHGIRWCFAPGCNANSVAEYVTSALLLLCLRHGLTLRGKTLGVIGVGNVGTRVVTKARALGMNVLLNDPPRQRAEGGPFCPLDELLAASDIVTLHVPLTNAGPDRTRGMADATFFRHMKPGALFFNCARGPVVVNAALMHARQSGQVSHVVLDTWDPEPAFPRDLLSIAEVATPHIAGHSFEGKVMGTWQVYEAACNFLGRKPEWSPSVALAPLPDAVIRPALDARSEEEFLWSVVSRVYNVKEDDDRLRAGDSEDGAARAAHFDSLRKNYPVRREFAAVRAACGGVASARIESLRNLGFVTESGGCTGHG